MLMCSKCGKRPAVVFISQMGAHDHNEGGNGLGKGLCIVCAKEAGIPQVDEYIKRMGISDEDLEEMANATSDLFDEGESFENGGSSTLPELFGNLMGNVEKLFGGAAMPTAQTPDGEPAQSGSFAKKPAKDKPKPKLKYLNTYCTNLSEKAASGNMDNVIGREREIDRVIQILSRRQKNNPCLIGEPGVGKTAIAEGIAQRISSGDVPYRLHDKTVYLLDMAALVAGTQFRGQFESRMKGLIEEVKRLGNVILFIDEVHSIVGTGDSEGSMSASNILKPALSRGEVQVIGATTFSEYRKYIEKDAALERRFQPVTVNEPTIADACRMLEGIKKYYEAHHKIHVSDAMIRECVQLSERYITDRYLPDKAIDLLDEACAYASTRNSALEEFEKLTDESAAADLAVEEAESSSEKEENPDYEKIAELKMNQMRISNRLEELKPQADAAQVTEKDLAQVIEVWTGIPASKIEATEFEKIRSLPEILSARVIGQEEAIKAVSAAIRRSRIHLSKRIRPASFIFVGPTGVGKTELVKVLGETLFDENEPLIRVDMSEYMEKHSVSKLIGSPPGYVGFDEAGQLTEKVRRRPYSVVLFDEIEKAHPDVMNILLQILDEGQIHDSQGRPVSFQNTVIVMTSNAGSTDRDTGVGFNKTQAEISKDKAMKALGEFLRPEFLGRVDEVVVFNPLTEEDYGKIAALMLDEMREPLEEQGISLAYKPAATALIAKKAYGKKLGGRDIRKVIREEVEDPLAEIMVEKGESGIKLVLIDAQDDKLIVKAE
ncbi:ATP-dependent Clp protease ATP-binding subunit [Ruminococcus sp. 210702-SL.1.03]|uniref:ATP-dependent Clp protease ATP-binding subunit n=1 Tax=Ruminococcus sp. 210702-SL.1.03 TaxID=2883233 RepID=UPI001D080DC7|nr:ATP-dependent Clp protease ATP-binding subunit [Ruminococcus sp. 210702-SL.1.03]MCB6615185.1 ATP-dependent Clp protease ATP-binding subunit [Ruminococcus sp. 210702-SL.1.03]